MADYKILLGTQLDTKGIDSGINKYHQKKTIEFKSQLDTSGIEKKISSYKAKKPIEINAKLNTSGIAKKIGEYKPKTPVKINAELDTKKIDTAIRGYKTKTPIKVDIKLDNSDISKQIRAYKASAPIKVSTKLDSNDITKQIRAYQSKSPIKLGVKLTTKDIDEKIRSYKSKTSIKLDVKINSTAINEQIKSFKPRNTIYLKAKLQKGAISEEIRNYKPTTPVTLKTNFIVGETKDIDAKIAYYQKAPVYVPVRLAPSEKNFSTNITNKAVKIITTVDQNEIRNNIEAAISGFTPSAKMPININPVLPKDINAQIKGLAAPTEMINVGVKIDKSKINTDIALFKPIATLGIKPDLMIENVESQIASYVAKTPVSVNVKINDINGQVGKQTAQTPVNVNVELNRQSIHEQIRGFKSNSKIAVGVKIDPKSVNQAIQGITINTPIRVGVQIDPKSVNQAIQGIVINTPIRVGVELNPKSVQDIKNQISNIRSQLQNLGNVKINIGGGGGIGGARNSIVNSIGSVGDIANVNNQISQITTTTNNSIHTIQRFRQTLASANFNNASIDLVTRHLEQMDIAVTNVTSRIRNNSLRLNIKGIDELGRTVTVLKEINLATGQITNIGKNISQSFGRSKEEVKQVNSAYREMKSLIKEITNTSIKINSARAAGQDFGALEIKLAALNARYDELEANFASGFDTNQTRNLSNQWAKVAHDVNIANEAISNAKKNMVSAIRGDFSGYDAEVKSIEGSIQRLSSVSKEVEIGIRNVRQALLDMRNASSDEELIAAEERYQTALKETRAQLLINQSIENKGFYGEIFSIKKEAALQRLNGLFEEGSRASKRFGAEVIKLKNELNMAGNTKGIDIVNGKIDILNRKIKSSGLQTKKWTTGLKEQFDKYKNYISVYSLFMYATQAMRSMFQQVKAIDTAMTELKKVTDETDASYNQFLSNAASRAKELGTTIDGLVASTADFARLGYGFEDSQELAEVANIYAVVGDEIESVEDATQSLISTIAAFKSEMGSMDNGDFAMSIVDKMNEVANNYAISSGGLGQALQRSASSMAAANNSLDETIAMITAANEVAQNPQKVGNAMKTISMRIRGAKTE